MPRPAILSRAALTTALLLTSALACAKVTQTAYFIDAQTHVASGILVAWDERRMRARLSDASGTAEGHYTQDAARRTLTLDAPLLRQLRVWDGDCQATLTVQRAVSQHIETRLSGTPRKGHSGWMTIGTDTVLDGCKAGQTTPFGDASQTGTVHSHVAMRATPTPRALVAGEGWAGLLEGAADPVSAHPIAQDTAQVDASGSAFVMHATGSVLPAALGGDGWLSTRLPSGIERIYKQVALDRHSGGEVWLVGDRVAGTLTWVDAWRLVTPQAGAAFTPKSAARVWRKADATYSREYRLYRNLTGLMVDDILTPEPLHVESPLTWRFAPQALHIDRTLGQTWQSDRLWVPLARYGAQQWVMESEQRTHLSTGEVVPLVPARVAGYTDMGAAIPPAARTKAGASPDTARRETAAAAARRP